MDVCRSVYPIIILPVVNHCGDFRFNIFCRHFTAPTKYISNIFSCWTMTVRIGGCLKVSYLFNMKLETCWLCFGVLSLLTIDFLFLKCNGLYFKTLCTGYNTGTKLAATYCSGMGSTARTVMERDPTFLHSAVGCMDEIKSAKNELKLYAITYKSSDIQGDNVLFGWLHGKLTMGEKTTDTVISPYVPPTDESQTYIPNNDQFPYVTPGSIVPTRFKHCREKWEPSIKMEKVHYEPCRMATDPMPTLGQTVWYDGEQNGAWFNYQIDFPICGFFLLPKTYLEFRMFFRTQNPDDCSWFENNTSGVSKELQTAMQKRIKFSSLIFGAADPEPPKDHPEVLCSNAIESGKPEWIESYDIHNYNVRLPSNNSWCTRASLEKDCFVGRCTKRLNNCNSYGWEWGRKTDKEASRKAANVSSRGEVIGYDNLTCYISDTVHVHSPCDWLRNGTDPDPYAKYPPYNPDPTRGGLCVGCLEAKNITEIYGIPCNSNIGRIIWGFRVTHGIFMALSTMFLVPWGTLFSRYYKETFMEKRYANVHVWHGMHIVLSLTGFGGICGGMAAGVLARYFLGFSTYMYVGRIHVAAGWLSTFFFLIVTATSCIRKFPLRVRVITIFLHFLIGTLTRFLWAVALLTSFYIPGSPSALNNIQRDGFTLEYFMIFVIFWLITDIVVHVLLRVFLSMADKKLTVPRNYAVVVPIPVIRPYAEKDTEGTGRRKIVLLVYAVISLLCALGLAVAMCWLDHWDSWKCNFGPMTETHNPGGKLGNMTDVWYDDLPKEPKY